MHIDRYLWILETLSTYRALTLEQLNARWVECEVDGGNPLPRRTFMTYRNRIEKMFGVVIKCNLSSYEYYIDEEENHVGPYVDWLLNSMSINSTLQGAGEVASRIILEEVPSAREFLSQVIDALKQNLSISFSYRSYTRSNVSAGVVVEPYFVKIFKQLWYVIGYNPKDGKIKTYALDRMSDLKVLAERPFQMPASFSPRDFFKDCFGITTNDNSAKEIKLKVSPVQAKYMRALPLHHSQQEMVQADGYSLFTFKMRLTYDLREHLLSMGSNIEVLSPPELKTQIREELRRTMALYE